MITNKKAGIKNFFLEKRLSWLEFIIILIMHDVIVGIVKWIK